MRCTRCDRLAVPQAVGLDPDGRVVFGWCLACLAEAGCRLVELPPTETMFHGLSVPVDTRPLLRRTARPAPGGDPMHGAVAIVASLMTGWGLVLVIASLFAGSRPSGDSSPMGNGTAPLLGVGGAATTMFGLGLLVLCSRRKWLLSSLPLTLLSWLGLVLAVGILAGGVIAYDPRRNVRLVLAAGLALSVAVISRLLERSQEDRPSAGLASFSTDVRPRKVGLGRRRGP